MEKDWRWAIRRTVHREARGGSGSARQLFGVQRTKLWAKFGLSPVYDPKQKFISLTWRRKSGLTNRT
jgi:hypothetical protein